LPAALGLLQQVLREPALPEKEFDIMKRERLAALEQMKTEPAMLAPRALQRELEPYPKSDIRYVPTIEESIERLNSITHAQVVRLYREFLGAQAGELTVVGDFDEKSCLPILKETFSGWKAATAYERIATPEPRPPRSLQQTLRTPDKANATFTAGLLFPMRDDEPDYPALVLANYILGSGTLSSRLGTRVRQKEGLSYGITSSLTASSKDRRASFTISAIVAPQNLPRLQECALEEVNRLWREGVTQAELDQARAGFLQARKVSLSSDAALAGMLNEFRHLDRTMLWEAEMLKKLQSVTPEQVASALNRHIDPKKLVLVSAGDF
jgi:zinc protease